MSLATPVRAALLMFLSTVLFALMVLAIRLASEQVHAFEVRDELTRQELGRVDLGREHVCVVQGARFQGKLVRDHRLLGVVVQRDFVAGRERGDVRKELLGQPGFDGPFAPTLNG